MSVGTTRGSRSYSRCWRVWKPRPARNEGKDFPLLYNVAEAYWRSGQPIQGLKAFADAEALSNEVGFPQTGRLRIKGNLLLLLKDSASLIEAERVFRSAIKIERGGGAKWSELRLTTELARLLRDTGRRDEARAMLSDIYNWFTEGFDTADLKDAKALLEELSNSLE